MTPLTCTCTFVPETPKSAVHADKATSLFRVKSGIPTIVTTPAMFFAAPINSPPIAIPLIISIPAKFARILTTVLGMGKGIFAVIEKGT